MKIATLKKCLSMAGFLAVLSAAPASAQFGGFNPGAFIPSGGRINPSGIINQGIGVMQEINRQQRLQERRRKQAIAAHEARERRKVLLRTKAGRSQLAREDAATKRRARQQADIVSGFARVLLGGGVGSGARQSSNPDYTGRRQCPICE